MIGPASDSIMSRRTLNLGGKLSIRFLYAHANGWHDERAVCREIPQWICWPGRRSLGKESVQLEGSLRFILHCRIARQAIRCSNGSQYRRSRADHKTARFQGISRGAPRRGIIGRSIARAHDSGLVPCTGNLSGHRVRSACP
jgi:hypothetical protein